MNSILLMKKNLCTWAMRCLLIEEGNRLILIDCGMGSKQSEKFSPITNHMEKKHSGVHC